MSEKMLKIQTVPRCGWPCMDEMTPEEVHIYNEKDVTDNMVKRMIRQKLKSLDMFIPFVVVFDEYSIEKEFRYKNRGFTYKDGTSPVFRIEHYHLRKWIVTFNKIKITLIEHYPYIPHSNRKFDENGTETEPVHEPVQKIVFSLKYGCITLHDSIRDILLATKEKLSKKAIKYLDKNTRSDITIKKKHCSICKRTTEHIQTGYICGFCFRGSFTTNQCIKCLKRGG